MKIDNQTFITIIFNTDELSINSINKLNEIQRQINHLFVHYEILVTCFSVSNFGEEKLNEFLRENNCFRILLLTNKVSNDAQLLAGFENAIGDYLVSCFEDKHSIRDIFRSLNYSINTGRTIFNIEKSFSNLIVKLKSSKNIKKRKIFRYCSIYVDGLISFDRNTLNLFLASGRMQDDIYPRIAKVSNEVFFQEYNSISKRGYKIISKKVEYLKRYLKFILFSSNNINRFLTSLLIFLIIISIFFSYLSSPIALILIKFALIILSLNIWIFSEYIYRSFMKDSKINPYRIKKEYNSDIMNPDKTLNIVSK